MGSLLAALGWKVGVIFFLAVGVIQIIVGYLLILISAFLLLEVLI